MLAWWRACVRVRIIDEHIARDGLTEGQVAFLRGPLGQGLWKSVRDNLVTLMEGRVPVPQRLWNQVEHVGDAEWEGQDV